MVIDFHLLSLHVCLFLLCFGISLCKVIRTLFALILSSFAMNFNNLIYGNLYHKVLSSSIFALLVDYMQCTVFTYFIIGLKSKDWSIIRVALDWLMFWLSQHIQLISIVILLYTILKPLGSAYSVRSMYRILT